MARKLHAEHVFNMSFQEGNPFTFVEVKTLLDGGTVGGRELSDEQQVLRISKAWNHLFELVELNQFELTQAVAHKLHSIIAEEALVWGTFRNENVSIAGTSYPPPNALDLPDLFDNMIAQANKINAIEQRAFGVFLDCARSQYYFDGNKRTGQLLMNGMLLAAGEHIASIPAAKTEAYNRNMLEFYDAGDEGVMRLFLAECRTDVGKMVRPRDAGD